MSNRTLAKIHIARKELQLSDDNYYAILAGFGVASSKDLTPQQVNELMSIFRRLGWKQKQAPPTGWGKQKYEYLRPRPADMADPRQLRMIEAVWRDVATSAGDASLEQFIERQTGIRKLPWLKKEHARAVLTALKNMKSKNK